MMVSVRCSSGIRMSLLLSRKRCVLHAGGDASRRLLRQGTHTHVPCLLQLSPDRQPKAVREVLICTKASARLLRNALITVGHEGARPFNLLPLTSSYSSLQGTNRYSG